MGHFGARVQIVVVVVWVVPVHVDLVIVAVELDARHIAIAIARTHCFLFASVRITDIFYAKISAFFSVRCGAVFRVKTR